MKALAKNELRAMQLEQELRAASSAKRLELQPELDRLLRQLEGEGTAVPRRLRNLHQQLLDEAMEAKFDNLPI